MAEKTIRLRAELVDRLESLATAQGRSVDDVLTNLLAETEAPQNLWTMELIEAMADETIVWRDVPDLSESSRERFQQAQFERWQQTQLTDEDDG